MKKKSRGSKKENVCAVERVDEAAKTPENQAIIAEIRKTDRLIDHPNRFYTFAND